MDLTNVGMNSRGVFLLGEFFAEIESETECSVCLLLRRSVDKREQIPADAAWLFDDSEEQMLAEVGWLDLHYPCQGNRKALIRACLPSEYHSVDQLDALKGALFQVLSIPASTVSVLYYFHVDEVFCVLPDDELGRR